jgi:pimeloyl-ACP methyl ester carboxylesterase
MKTRVLRFAASLATAAALVPATLTIGQLASAASLADQTSKPTVVLVHGAWADGSAWDGVISRLQRAGYPVEAFPIPLQGLASDSSVLAAFLQSLKGPVILVGHSYGGSVITNAATGNPNVKALVYVDAFAPAAGQSVADLESSVPGSCLSGGGDPTKALSFVFNPTLPAGAVDVYAQVAPNGPYPGYAACFANDLPMGEASLLAATQRPLSSAAVIEKSGPPAWAQIPSWYALGTLDNVIVPAEQLAMAQAIHAHVIDVPASHLAMVSHPAAVTSVILAAANAST